MFGFNQESNGCRFRADEGVMVMETTELFLEELRCLEYQWDA
jgi:hypothetical protein